jgi:hypothetical protein
METLATWNWNLLLPLAGFAFVLVSACWLGQRD